METSRRMDLGRFYIKKYFPLLICCFMLAGCSDSADNDDDKIGGGGGSNTTTTTNPGGGTGGPGPTLDPRAAGTCQEVAEREIAGQSGLSVGQGAQCSSEFHVIESIIDSAQITDADQGMCCTRRCIEAGAENITSGVQSDHSCVIVGQERYLQCWGDNSYGQLGNGCRSNSSNDESHIDLNYVASSDSSGCYDDEAVPADQRLKDVRQVVLGKSHTCALIGEGRSNQILCWGENDQGQLGREGGPSLKPVAITMPKARTQNNELTIRVKSVTAGDFHTCLLADEGDESIFCWGRNNEGQTGRPFKLTVDEDGGNPSWSVDDSNSIPEPLYAVVIAATPQDYGSNSNVASCDGGSSATCVAVGDIHVPVCDNSGVTQNFPKCDNGGVPICDDTDSISCPDDINSYGSNSSFDAPLSPNDLARQLNNRIIAESIDECSLPEAATNGEILFDDCGLKNGHDPGFKLTSSKKKFWENATARTDGLPAVPPNFKCEDFYNVDHAKNPVEVTDDNGDEIDFRNAYKNILCDLGSTTEVSSTCEGEIESLKNECEFEKSKWANALERLYIKLNFNQTDEDSIDTYKYLSAGANHNCAINQEDEVYCFGDNRKGQLGQEEYASSECTETTFNGLAHIDGNSDENEKIFPYPIRVRDSKESDTDDYMSSVRQIAVGADFNCARITQENAQTGPKLKCWGGGNDLSSVRGNSKDTAECYPQSVQHVKERLSHSKMNVNLKNPNGLML